MFFSLNNNLNHNNNDNLGNINNNNHGINGNNPFHNALPTPSPSASPSTPGPAGGNNGNNGYRLLSAQGMETLQAFLREHGNECIKQFVKVRDSQIIVFSDFHRVLDTSLIIAIIFNLLVA